jgi:hypothetical protein
MVSRSNIHQHLLLSFLEYFPYKEWKTAGNVADAQTWELETTLLQLKMETQKCMATDIQKLNFVKVKVNQNVLPYI